MLKEERKYILSLCLGSYPKEVDTFQNSRNLLEQLIYIDHKLTTIHDGLKDKEWDFKIISNEETKDISDRIKQYVELLVDIKVSNDKKSDLERFYEAVILAHMYLLISDFKSMKKILDSISVSADIKYDYLQTSEADFFRVLNCRYYTLLGLVNQDKSKWETFLLEMDRPFSQSNILANKWLEILYTQLSLLLTKSEKITFKRFTNLKFFDNKLSAISFGGFLCKKINHKFVDSKFKDDFSAFILSENLRRMSAKSSFPDAKSSTGDFENYVEVLSKAINESKESRLLERSSYKKFLIYCLLTTYQSKVVIYYYIKVLLENNELDEAFGSLKTYVGYIKKDQEQKKGEIYDILSIIDIYSLCLRFFNPLEPILNHSGSKRRFKSTSNDIVLEALSQYVTELEGYLLELSKQADIVYESEEVSGNPLSFLYHIYNPNVMEKETSYLVALCSDAWFSLGYYFYYKSTYDSYNIEFLEANSRKTLAYYKRSLIMNPTGNENYLFQYALTLAYDSNIQPALRLCKFILKKYSNSFKTWNLMALILTAFESGESQNVKIKSTKSIIDNSFLNSEVNGNRLDILSDLEKAIENALNIAGIYMNKSSEENKKVSLKVKYEILQLKLTQLAIWEQINGIQYILDHIPEVFFLYFELFDMQIEAKKSDNLMKNDQWSHRPSFIDPNIKENGDQRNGHSKSSAKDRHSAKEKISHISKGHRKSKDISVKKIEESDESNNIKRKILQEIWLWASKIYMKMDLLDEAEQCIIEAESLLGPNFKTFTALGLLTSKNRKLLALQEFERSLESLSSNRIYNNKDYGETLLGLAKLFIVEDDVENSLFISVKDRNAGLIRVKNYLEKYSFCWPHGYNNSETWWFLSKVYELLDDKPLLNKSLWRCVELEDFRPARYYNCCDNFDF